MSYSSYHRPLTISEGPKQAEFGYDGFGERWVMRMYTGGVLDYRKEYYDDGSVLYYTGQGTLAERLSPVGSDQGIAWIEVIRPGSGGGGGPIDPPPLDGPLGGGIGGLNGVATSLDAGVVLDDYSDEPCCPVTEVYYPYADHLGSIAALTDGVGNVVHQQAFDSWGRRRNVSSWYTDDSQTPPQQYRWLWGYTGHEQLDEFGLVNMNARLYDPKLGRMLSVDNYVSDAGSALAYNRYSYANCNPISYVDPDGNHPVLIAMAIGAAISAATYTAQAAFSPGGLQRNFHFGDFATSTFFGAVIGGVTAGVGQAFGPTWVVGTSLDNGKVITLSMALTHEAGRAAAHGGLNALFSFGQGGNPLVGFVSGTVSTFASHGLVMGGVELGDVGGAFFSAGMGAGTSYLQGGNPWIGAGAALMSYSLNQLQQDGDGGGDGDGGKGKMKPASAYDYSQESIPGKWEDDWAYITEGEGGNPITRWAQLFARDWGQSTFEQKANFIMSGPMGSRGSLRYHPRINAAKNLYHNFPRSFDGHIMKNGFHSIRINDRTSWYEMLGTINGTRGIYQIGVNQHGVIYHRNFVPYNTWLNRGLR